MSSSKKDDGSLKIRLSKNQAEKSSYQENAEENFDFPKRGKISVERVLLLLTFINQGRKYLLYRVYLEMINSGHNKKILKQFVSSRQSRR